MPDTHPIVLFDGVCNFCNGTVNFLIDHDPNAIFRFAPIQSEAGRAQLRAVGEPIPEGDPESVVLIDDGRTFRDSAAGLRIWPRLGGLWRLTAILLLVPRPIRDGVYRVIARNRYRWFGRTESCRVPTPELARRFLT